MTKTNVRTIHRGGKRDGAGRPPGSGKYGEPTKAVRIPQSMVNQVQQFLADVGQEKVVPYPIYTSKVIPLTVLNLPLYEHKVAAGFPSPADDYSDTRLDLNQYLIKNPASTFYVRVEGVSMINAGIHPNDLLVVDISMKAQDGNIIIALIDGEFTVKRLKIKPNQEIWLVPENENYPPLRIQEGMDFRIWGVVTNVIHALLPS
ncbi:MAG: LexA family protein [Candidatus Berkiellales bacterium]